MNGSFSKTLRTERGLSQHDLAERMFVTRPTIARWESGTCLPYAVTIRRLAEVLGIVDQLLYNCSTVLGKRGNFATHIPRKKAVFATLLPQSEQLKRLNGLD